MVPVTVGQEEVILKTILIDQIFSESPYAGSGINDDDVITLGSDFQAGGVAAVFEIFRS